MKRSPLKRSTIPLRRTPLSARGNTLPQSNRLRHRSVRTDRMYRQLRRPLVAEILAANPICQRCCAASSTEVHELLSRARGGSITDPANCVALCHDCHHWITTHPAEATATGWLNNSWDREATRDDVA